MAAQKGQAIVVSHKNNEVAPDYEVIAGLRTKSITLNSEAVDVTNSDSTGMWRELLEGAGVKSATISGSGVFVDSAAEAEVLEALTGGTIRDMTFFIPDFGTFEGKFQCTSLEFAGEYNREVTYNMTFESAGEVTFTPPE